MGTLAPFPDIAADRRFLDYFPQNEKSTIANLYLAQVRSGQATTPEAVHRLALAALRERWGRAIEYSRQPWGNRDAEQERAERLAEQLGILTRQAAAGVAYGAWALEWEALSPAERERRKNSNSAQHIRNHVDREPATEAQINHLRKLGYSGPIETKGHASSLIDVIHRGGRVEMAVAS